MALLGDNRRFVKKKARRQTHRATSYYVTEVLDDGPVIEQHVAHISHRDALDDWLQKGRELEKPCSPEV